SDSKGGGRLQEAKRRGKMEREQREQELNQKLQQLVKNLPKNSTIVVELKVHYISKHCIFLFYYTIEFDLISVVFFLCRQMYVDLMRSTQAMTEAELRSLSEKYDSVYLHPDSFSVAALAVGSVLQLVDRVLSSELRNGFALVRPPGHHAQRDQANGFSVFNNVAIAARYAQTKVLIVDWDVHHGQGIQYSFQDDPNVVYFSAHRFEHGSFWPHLSESNSDFIGGTRGAGRTINLPWNKTGMTDADYIAAFYHLLLPVAYEVKRIILKNVIDSFINTGEMCVSPQCFQLLTRLLMSIAEGRIILALEGGYNLSQTAEGAAACVKALLGGACPPLSSPTAPSNSALESISQTISSLYPYWASLQVLEGYAVTGGGVSRESTNQGSLCCASPTTSVSTKTGLVYDERMMEHLNMWDKHHPEQPNRISKIYSQHQQLGLEQRCERLEVRLATEEELLMCHSADHIARMKASSDLKPRDLFKLGEEFNSIFLNNQSYECALMAAGGCFRAVEAVLTGQVSNSVAIVRPPGHHAEKDFPCGFCLFNTAALTARYAQKVSNNPSLRVMILDWDVHHGNGTQHMFEDDDSVLYVSLHRYDNGSFFPSSSDAACDKVGVARGEGFNVNVAWSGGRMGDADYIAAFHQVVMPIATEFNPDLVLVSAGFDAARGDPLGGYNVTPEGYAHFTHLLLTLASGKLVMILEGGYNLTSISESMALCTSVLLGDPPPSILSPPPHHSAVATINETSLSLLLWVGRDPRSAPALEIQTVRERKRQSHRKRVSLRHRVISTSIHFFNFLFQNTLFVVDPLPWCPHLDSVKPLPPAGLDVFKPCEDCGSEMENWVCLTCYKVFCGRYVNEHMVIHGVTAEHPVVLSYADLSVWCYLCESYVHNQILFEAKNAAHWAKFGEEVPPWT
uniref:Protein deacetylase HDAC6 n=1 Tax=Periophthalmus magnuspinnatus TaxID=409849 RepID=A0A3B4AX09_9GOBI